MKRLYRKGDLVKVWSLQSFNHGGFLNGDIGIVSQNQLLNGSVLIIVSRKYNGKTMLNTNYEVYDKQLELIEATNTIRIENVDYFIKLNNKIREVEQTKLKKQGIFEIIPFHWSPEFYINNSNNIELDKSKLEYPEDFI